MGSARVQINLSMFITLFCLIKGSFPAKKHVFPVKISKEETIGELKQVIKAEDPQTLNSISAKNIRLWKVEIPFDRDDLIQNLTLQDNDELLNANDIKDYWNEVPQRKRIHVIIDQPELVVTPSREVSELRELIATLQSQGFYLNLMVLLSY